MWPLTPPRVGSWSTEGKRSSSRTLRFRNAAKNTHEYNGERNGDGEDDNYVSIDRLADIHIVIGSQFNDGLGGSDGEDKLFGGPGHDYMDGYKGADYLDGGDGDDRLFGGEGHDVLWGNAGADIYVLSRDNDQMHYFNPFDGDRLDVRKMDLFSTRLSVNMANWGNDDERLYMNFETDGAGYFNNRMSFYSTAQDTNGIHNERIYSFSRLESYLKQFFNDYDGDILIY